jgi:hypothetical protein
MRRMHGGSVLNAIGYTILPKVTLRTEYLPEPPGKRSPTPGVVPNAGSSSARRAFSGGLKIEEIVVEPSDASLCWVRVRVP